MRRSVLMGALAACVSTASWCGSATAQSVEFYVGPSGSYDRYYDEPAYRDYSYGPRVYGYYSDDDRNQRHLRQPEDYRTGSKRWWKQMDRTGRGGHTE